MIFKNRLGFEDFLALAVCCLGLTTGGPAARAAAPPEGKSQAPPPAARDRSKLLEGIGAPLQVFLIPEAAGADFSDANCYVVCDRPSGEALIIDAGSRSAPFALRRAADMGLRVVLLVATHFHLDHTGGAPLVLSRTSAKMVAPVKEAGLLAGEVGTPAEKKQVLSVPVPRIDVKAKGSDELKLGAHAVKVIEVPGHSPGGICLHFPAEKVVFTGDVLFKGSIGRTGIPHAAKSADAMVAAVRSKLLVLPDDTAVLPGHGPPTTIGAEKASNPWLQAPAKAEKKAEKGEKKKR